MADPDVTVKPEFGGAYVPVFASDGTGSLERVFLCSGPGANDPLATLTVPFHSDIPKLGSYIEVDGEEDDDPFRFYLKEKRPERDPGSNELIRVVCHYDTRESESGEASPDSKNDGPDEDRKRRRTYGAPFNEHLSMRSMEVETHTGYANEEWVGYGGVGDRVFLPKPITIHVPVVTWKFDVYFTPKQAFWQSIGGFNAERYPDIGYSGGRPFEFNPGYLLYLGAEAQMADVSSLAEVGAHPSTYHWIWKLTLEFAFRGTTWGEEKIDITKTFSGIPFHVDRNLYHAQYMESQEADDQGMVLVKNEDGSPTHSISADEVELPLLIKNPDTGNYEPPWQVRPERRFPCDFTEEFGFYWGSLHG